MRRTKEQIQVQVGAFLAIGILLFMTAIFILGSKQNFFQTHYRLICYFDDISGLRIGAPVQLAGINVGFIENIEFEERKYKQLVNTEINAETLEPINTEVADEEVVIIKVKVTMKIDTFYQDRIRTDTVASVVTQGLLGDRMISLTVGSNKRTKLGNNDEILEVRNPSGFTQLVEKGDALMIDAQTFLQNTDLMIGNINTILGEVINGNGLVHDVIYDDGTTNPMHSVDRILANLERASGNLNSITAKINNGQGTLGALVNDDSLYQDVKTLMGKANRNRLLQSVIQYTMKTKDKQQLK